MSQSPSSGFIRSFSPTPKFMVTPLVCIALICSVLSFSRNAVWQDRQTVWEDVVRKSPFKARGYYNFGVYLQKNGQLSQALELYTTAIMLDPLKGEALVNRGNIYDEIHQPYRALEDYNRAIAINTRDESAYYNRAVTYERLGRLDDAMNGYRRSCDLGQERGCDALAGR